VVVSEGDGQIVAGKHLRSSERVLVVASLPEQGRVGTASTDPRSWGLGPAASVVIVSDQRGRADVRGRHAGDRKRGWLLKLGAHDL
jgi:hypothetical protein